jgi:DNA modification methylase
MGRSFIGIEREQEYMNIAQERCEVSREELIKFFKMDKDNQTKLDL